MSAATLDADALRWIEALVGGSVGRCEVFAHTRPMWLVDVETARGARVALFVRGDRGSASALSTVYGLGREALIAEALWRAGVPTPRCVGYSPEHQILVFERIGGESDLIRVTDSDRRLRIALHFIDTIAQLHAIPANSLGLDALGVPSTPRDIALAELRIGEQLFADACGPSEPIVALSRRWLHAHPPAADIEACFVQGDTGPGNFIFVGDRVTHLVDWEIAHFGDPMEDLAAICVRDMVTPFAPLPTLFARYAEVRGQPVALDRVRYHRVSKCVRSLFAILSYTEHHADPTWHGWRGMYLKCAVQALAEAMHIDLDGPAAPDVADEALDELVNAAALDQSAAPLLRRLDQRARARMRPDLAGHRFAAIG